MGASRLQRRRRSANEIVIAPAATKIIAAIHMRSGPPEAPDGPDPAFGSNAADSSPPPGADCGGKPDPPPVELLPADAPLDTDVLVANGVPAVAGVSVTVAVLLAKGVGVAV